MIFDTCVCLSLPKHSKMSKFGQLARQKSTNQITYFLIRAEGTKYSHNKNSITIIIKPQYLHRNLVKMLNISKFDSFVLVNLVDSK